jgi:hypothetical protein
VSDYLKVKPGRFQVEVRKSGDAADAPPPATATEAQVPMTQPAIARFYLGVDAAAASPSDWRRASERFGRPVGLPAAGLHRGRAGPVPLAAGRWARAARARCRGC